MKESHASLQEEEKTRQETPSQNQRKADEGKTKRMPKHPLAVRLAASFGSNPTMLPRFDSPAASAKRPYTPTTAVPFAKPPFRSSPSPAATFMLLPLATVDAVAELQIWLYGLWVITGSTVIPSSSPTKEAYLAWMCIFQIKGPSPGANTLPRRHASNHTRSRIPYCRSNRNQCVESKGATVCSSFPT